MAAGLGAAIAGCGPSPDAVVAVIPQSSVAPLTGGADLPDPARVLLVDADAAFAQGDYAAIPPLSDRALEAAATDPDLSDEDQWTITIVAGVVGAAGYANQGFAGQAQEELPDACDDSAQIGARTGLGRVLAGLCWSTAASIALQTNDAPGASAALVGAARYSTVPPPGYLEELCSEAETRGQPGACQPIQAITETPTTSPGTSREGTPTTAPSSTTPTSRTAPSSETSSEANTRTNSGTALPESRPR